MLFLSGAIVPAMMERPGYGVMLTPLKWNRLDLSRTPWAADNGCFTQGDSFRIGQYITYLEERMSEYRDTCLFANAPDVVADAEATWARSRPVLPLIRSLGYAASFVAQDGMEHMRVQWDEFDALFIGGSTQWKLSEHAYRLAQEAKRRGKWVHMGRVNSRRRAIAAASMGVDSIDGNQLVYGPDKYLPRLDGWMRELQRQPSLWGGPVDLSGRQTDGVRRGRAAALSKGRT